MERPMTRIDHRLSRGPIVAGLVLAAVLAVLPRGAAAQYQSQVKAAFLLNFARLSEWPALRPSAPIVQCIVGDTGVAAELSQLIRNVRVDGHAVEVVRPDVSKLSECHVVFVAASDVRRSSAALGTLRALPVLTVSDDVNFARSGGIIEFAPENGQMRFIVNVDAMNRAGVRLSSRLLGYGRVIRDGDGR
jgi:hypothetical protein